MSTADAIRDSLISPNVPDSNMEAANVVDVIAGAGYNIARAIRLLGNADASTPMGGLEAHGKTVLEAGDNIAGAISELAQAVNSLAEKLHTERTDRK